MVANKMRTALTMLGIVIGVGAVIAMISIGQGAAQKIREQFSSMGTNLLTVRTGNPKIRFGPGGPVGQTATVTSLVPADADANMRAELRVLRRGPVLSALALTVAKMVVLQNALARLVANRAVDGVT